MELNILELIEMTKNISTEEAKASILRSELPEYNKESKPIDLTLIYSI